MGRTHRSIASVLGSVGAGILYPLFLLVSTLFVVPIALFQLILPARSAHHSRRHGFVVPRKTWIIAIDFIAAMVTYITADYLRCTLYMGKPWPEVVDGHETAWIHALMLACLPFAWTTILFWLGWYKPRWRSWRWRAVNTVAAAVLLALFMSCFALLVARILYPRVQIVAVVILLPLVTGILRSLIEHFGRSNHEGDDHTGHLDPAW
ncbi:MAG: hypothetical protein ACE5E1_03265 [Phycisphaerae bacterium]